MHRGTFEVRERHVWAVHLIATSRLKIGRLEAEKKRVPGLAEFIQANEPRLIAFNEYSNEDGTEVGVVTPTRTPWSSTWR